MPLKLEVSQEVLDYSLSDLFPVLYSTRIVWKSSVLNLFFQLVVLFTPGSLPSPYLSPLKSGLVALSAEMSQHGVQSVQVHFHRSLLLYFSIRRHHSLQKMERCILSTRIPFSQAFHSNLRCKNCGQQLSPKWKRQQQTPWDVTGQRCLLEQLSLHNLPNTGSLICCWYDIQSNSESQQFPFIRFCFSTCSLVLVHSQ